MAHARPDAPPGSASTRVSGELARAPSAGDGASSSIPAGARLDAVAPRRLDLKALRMAVHGWWLGNPLVYKPGAADLVAVARELAGAGAASGTLILGETPTTAGSQPTDHDDRIEAVLILRPPLPGVHWTRAAGDHWTPLREAALQAVAQTAQSALGPDAVCTCDIEWPSEVVLGRAGARPGALLCSVDVEERPDVALVRLRLALDRLRAAGVAGHRDEDELPAAWAALFARSDWREVFLARVLHAFDARLREAC